MDKKHTQRCCYRLYGEYNAYGISTYLLETQAMKVNRNYTYAYPNLLSRYSYKNKK